MESKPKYPTNNDVDKVIKEFSEVVSQFVKDMKQCFGISSNIKRRCRIKCGMTDNF